MPPVIQEETLQIKFYRLASRNSDHSTMITEDMVETVTNVLENLINDSAIIVEVEKVEC